jgi:glycosyltransferase involved in cell wall biosynthesis
MTKPKISVVVPILNSCKYLPACMDSVVAAVDFYGNADLTIVDNGSTDGTWEMLSSTYADRATVLQIKDVTISALRNRGAALSTGEYLSFVDADCHIAPDYFDKAIEVFAASRADAAGCVYSLPVCPCWVEETWTKLHGVPGDGAANYIPSGNFLVRRKAFDAVGGFDECLVTGEDAEICQRLWRAGYSVYKAQSISAVHLGNPKTLAHFFRKEVWQGLGMFGTFHRWPLDKPVVMTLAHLLLCVAAVLNLLAAKMPIGLRLLSSLFLLLLAPAMTVAYRYLTLIRVYRPLGSLLLYHFYLSARVVALFQICGRAVFLQLSRNRRA